jgi:sugar phosphate isomerase/epimerase
MKYILFSKLVRELPIPELIAALKRIGADGADLAVRDGHPVNPGNVRQALAPAVRQFLDAGLSVPMVSAATNFTDARSRFAEDLWAACHDAGVDHVKIGYWNYRGRDYWTMVDAARKEIERFQGLATRFGPKVCLHNHSGNYLGVNASAVMHLARDFDPATVAVYLDPGHLNVNGEPITMAFDMAGAHLALVAVKDSLILKPERPDRARDSKFLPLGEGTVDWREMMRVLVARNYQGPLSFHSEYDGWPVDRILDQTRKDMAYLRAIEAEVRKKSG